MPDIDRRLLIGIPVAALMLLFLGFGIGRATVSESAPDPSASGSAVTTSADDSEADSSSPDTTQDTVASITGDAAAALPPAPAGPGEDIPAYGTDADRESFLTGLVEAGVAGGTRQGLLTTADHVCYTLERLQAQGRSSAFAVRVVWNESLLELDPQDLAAFAAVFTAAPYYLCPESAAYGEDVAYWLGY